MKGLEFKIDFLDKNGNFINYEFLSAWIGVYLDNDHPAYKVINDISEKNFELVKNWIGKKIRVQANDSNAIGFRELESIFEKLPNELKNIENLRVVLVPANDLELYYNLIPYKPNEPDIVRTFISPRVESNFVEYENCDLQFISCDNYGFYVRFRYYDSHNCYVCKNIVCYSYHVADGSIDFNLI